MRKLLWLLIVLLLSNCRGNKEETGRIIDHIPQNAAILIQLRNPSQFFNELRNNAFLTQNESHSITKEVRKKFSIFNFFSHDKTALIAFSSDNSERIDFTYISEGIPEIKNLDSISNKKVETSNLRSWQVTSYTIEDQTTYITQFDSIFIASNSRKIIEKIFENKGRERLSNESDFERSWKAASDRNPTIFINHQNLTEAFLEIFPAGSAPLLNSFSHWTALDTKITQNRIKFDGITTAGDTLPKFINLFKGVTPSVNELADITPLSSGGFLSYAFQDFAPLKGNLENYTQREPTISNSEEQLLLNNTIEAGVIYTTEGNVFVLKSLKNEALESFSAGKAVAEEFRDTFIFYYDDTGQFKKNLAPLIAPENLKYYAQLENFILFSEELNLLKQIIADVHNKNTISESEAYQTSSENLSTEASALWVAKNDNLRTIWGDKVSEEKRQETKSIETKDFPFTAFQFIYSNNFAHVHAILEKNEQKMSSSGVQQIASISLESDIAGPAVFIKNHRSKGMDVAVQDKNNNLYLISKSGNIYWKKQLESRILGEIKQVDLLRNGRIQLAFATPNNIQVIDREGNKVKPFPLEFNDEITQPMALFDYDNNRKYRFVIVQDRDVFMYNNKANRVKGFGFTKATEKIAQPPKHIRMGNKDYIVVPEASGKLNILDRRGNVRVPVKEKFSLSGNQWYEYNNQFVSTNKAGELVKISQNGNMSKEALGLTENHFIDATPEALVTLSENQLTVKGNTVELDYGLYTQPKIFHINNKHYINITDTQANRVFLFDSKASLLPGFPVYGNSSIDLDNIDTDPNLEFVVSGEDDTLLLYEVKE